LPSPLILIALGFTGLAAGFVDAIAGGGGLISVPALLAAGLPPVDALATNKLQSSIGTAIATRTYWRRGFVSVRPLLAAMAAGYAGGLAGAWAVQLIDVGLLARLVPVALIAVAGYFVFAPQLSDADREARLGLWALPLVALVLGFYDGILGPGTGSFFTLAFVGLFGFGMTRAAANTKVVNLASNLAALTLFIPTGHVVWPVALVMAVGQTAGGYLGARTGIRFGARVIRPLVAVVSVALAAKALLAP
jgi:uncharacterized membrane protein YfcA